MTKTHAAHGTTAALQADGGPDLPRWTGGVTPIPSSEGGLESLGDMPYAVTESGDSGRLSIFGDPVTLTDTESYDDIEVYSSLTIAGTASITTTDLLVDDPGGPFSPPGYLFVNGQLNDSNALVAPYGDPSFDPSYFDGAYVTVSGGAADWTTSGGLQFGSPNAQCSLTVVDHARMSWGPGGLQAEATQITVDSTAQLSGRFIMQGSLLTAVAAAGAGSSQVVTVGAFTLSSVYYTDGTYDGGATFGSSAGTRLDVTGAIGEDPANPGQVLAIDAGFVTLGHADNTYTGGTYLVAGTLELAAAGAAGTGKITFSDYGAGTLQIDQGAFPINGISGFAWGDVIQLKGVVVSGSQFVVNFGFVGGALLIDQQGSGTKILYFSDGSYANGSFFFRPDTVDGVASTEITLNGPPCFLAGTRILTARGEIPVEQIAVGDQVITQSGRAAPVRWVGQSHFDLARCPAPERFRPIRIRRNALAPGVPSRDLLVSRGHAMKLDGVLIPALYLANGATIVEDRGFSAVTYCHVELDRHDVLLAEGAPAESYLDTGNRQLFESGGSLAEDRAGGEPCAPVVQAGVALMRVREALRRRIPASGTTRDPDLHLLADDVACAPAGRTGDTYHFVLPRAPRSLRVMSRANIPNGIGAVPDMRMLGVAVGGVTLRAPGHARTLDLSAPVLGPGFSWPERAADGAAFRWTDGDATMPVAFWRDIPAFTLDIQVNATVPYWITPSPAAR